MDRWRWLRCRICAYDGDDDTDSRRTTRAVRWIRCARYARDARRCGQTVRTRYGTDSFRDGCDDGTIDG